MWDCVLAYRPIHNGCVIMNPVHIEALDLVLTSCGFNPLDEYAKPSDIQLLEALFGSTFDLVEPEPLAICDYMLMAHELIQLRMLEDMCQITSREVMCFNAKAESLGCPLPPIDEKKSFICYGLIMGGSQC